MHLRLCLAALLFLPVVARAQHPTSIDIAAPAVGKDGVPLRGAAGEPKTDRVLLKPGQLQRFNVNLADPYKYELCAVSVDGKKPVLMEDSGKKWCLYHNDVDEKGVPVGPELLMFQLISKDVTYYRCWISCPKGKPVPVVPPGPPGPTPKPDWKYLPALEKAWAKDVTLGTRAEDLHQLADILHRAQLDPSVGTTDKFYSWLGLAYTAELREKVAAYVRNSLADVFTLELGTDKANLWTAAERQKFDAVITASIDALHFLATATPAPAPPDPVTPPGPIAGGNLRVIFVRETNALYPKEQVYTLTSPKFLAWLSAKCPKDGVRQGWRFYDPQQSTDLETATFKALWAEAQPKLTGVKLPAMIIKTDKTPQAVVESLPMTEPEAQALLEKYAGK